VRGRIALLAIALWIPVVVGAQPPAANDPADTLEAFHAALRGNQPERVLDQLASDAVIYEQGFSDTSRDAWARKQLGNAIAFARDTERRVLHRQSGQTGDHAWVLSTTQTALDVTTRQVVMNGAETAMLRREADGRWKIVHLHWSAHEADADSAGGLDTPPGAEPARDPSH
jgi:ketosteroid isomerase-like protein